MYDAFDQRFAHFLEFFSARLFFLINSQAMPKFLLAGTYLLD